MAFGDIWNQIMTGDWGTQADRQATRQGRQAGRQDRRAENWWNDADRFWNDAPAENLGQSYDQQVEALIAQINAMVGEGGFKGLQDTARAEADAMFGDTTYTDPVTGEVRTMTAADWSTMSGAVPFGQSFEDWAADNNIQLNDIGAGREGLETLTGQLQNPDFAGAEDFSARMLGYTDATAAQTAMASMLETMKQSVGQFEGFSPEDRALRERQNRVGLRDIEARETRMLQNVMGNTGSMVQMLQASDESTRRISLVQLGQEVSLNEEEYARQVAQQNQAIQAYDFQAGAGIEGFNTFMSTRTASLQAAVQAYNVNLNSMLAENAQYLATHQGDMAILEQNATRMNNMALMQLGLDQASLDAAQKLYDSEVQPYIDQINALLFTEEMQGTTGWAKLMELYATIATIITPVVAGIV